MSVHSRYRAGLWHPYEKPMYGVLLNPYHPLARGLVGCWLFNEGGGNTVFDQSGLGYHGTLGGGTAEYRPDWVSGKMGPALDFDGSDYVSIPNFTLSFPATLIIWVKPDSGALSESRTFLSREGGTSFLWYYLGGGEHVTCISIFDGSDHFGSAGLLQENEWQQIGLTFDVSGNGYHWYNGKQDLSVSGVTEPTNPFELRIAEWSTHDWIGEFAEVLIYNRVLSANEIWQLYTDPFCMFYHPALEAELLYEAAPPAGIVPQAMHHYRMLRT